MLKRMRPRVRPNILMAAPALWSVLLCAQTPAPEAFSLLGKPLLPKPDESRSVDAADRALAIGPATAELLLAAANARDRILRFSESIPLYTRGMADYPGDVRFPRFRGHRFISTRRFDSAIADLKQAAELAPASFDVSYHLALAYYLRGDYNHAAREFQRCLALSSQPAPAYLKGLPAGWQSCYVMDDYAMVSATDWAWRALRRAGKPEEADRLLAASSAQVNNNLDRAHSAVLLLYKGIRTEDQLLAAPDNGNAADTIGYGIGLWHWLAGRRTQSCAAWQRTVGSTNWAAFGVIAAEAELARGVCKTGTSGRKR